METNATIGLTIDAEVDGTAAIETLARELPVLDATWTVAE